MALWKIRMFQEGDQKDIVNLINLVFIRAKFDLGLWSWKYKSAPHGFLAIVAEHNGGIVGHMGLQLFDMKVGRHIVTGSQACDLCVHPDYLRQGMFLAMGKALMKVASENKVPFTYGFPTEPAYYGHIKYGWFDVAMIPQLVTYLDVQKVAIEHYSVLNRIEPIVKKSSKLINWFLFQQRRRSQVSAENLELNIISRFDEGVDQLWSEKNKDFGIAVVRDHRFLNWRYLARPDVRYTVFVAKRNREVQGFIVFFMRKSGNRNIGYVVDVLALSRDVLLCLLKASIADMIRQNADSIICWMQKGCLEYYALREIGFTSCLVPRNARPRLIARINSNVLFQPYTDAEKWYVTSGDSDYV